MTGDTSLEHQTIAKAATQYGFPRNFLVLDLETSGFSPDKDVIVDYGWAVVRDNVVVHRGSALVNWSIAAEADQIRNKLAYQAAEYAKKGLPHYYPWERLCDEGGHPEEIIYRYTKLIYDHLQAGGVIVGHGFHFDQRFINAHTDWLLQGYQLSWGDNAIWDTGLIEKAAQMNRPPFTNEPLSEWLLRVRNAWAKVKYSLSGHCIPKYNLADKCQLDMTKAHTAEADCLATFHLIRTYAEIAERASHAITG